MVLLGPASVRPVALCWSFARAWRLSECVLALIPRTLWPTAMVLLQPQCGPSPPIAPSGLGERPQNSEQQPGPADRQAGVGVGLRPKVENEFHVDSAIGISSEVTRIQ